MPLQAIAGRSNVGKSTLLNALLYGNQPKRSQGNQSSNEMMVRQHTRGKTPETVKLPKGAKAVTSDKPGETKQITFYQLSSIPQQIVHEGGKEAADGDDMFQDSKCFPKKLRLVDLPGYGFSFTPRDHGGFRDLLLRYLLERGKTLKRIILLLDGRHGMKKADFEFLEMLQDEAAKV